MKWLHLLTGYLLCSALLGAQVTPAHFANAAHYSLDHGGLAVRVEQGGHLLFESYADGFSASTPHKIYSGTKSFVAVGALIAMQEGLLTLDEKASDTLTEWRGDRRRSITISPGSGALLRLRARDRSGQPVAGASEPVAALV